MTTALVAPNKLTKAEDELLALILKDKSKTMPISIPDDSTPEDILSSIRSCASMINKMDHRSGQLVAVLGRLMVLARKNEDVWKLAGHKSFEQFSQKEISEKYGMSRASLWVGKKIMSAYPELTLLEYGKVGSQKLVLLAKYITSKDANYVKWLDKAAELTFDNLKSVLEDKFLDHGGNTGATLTLKGSKAQVKELKKFLSREDIKAAAEETDPIKIILAMTQEVESEWCEKGEAALKEQAEKEEAANAAG